MYRCRYQGEGHSCPWGCVACEYSDDEYKSRKKDNALCPYLKEDHFSKVPRDEFILLVAPDIDNGKPKTPVSEEILDKMLSIQYKMRRHITMIAFDGYQNNAIAEYAMSRDVELHMIKNLNGRSPIRQWTVLEYLDKHPETPKGALLIDPGQEARASVKDIQEVFGFPVRFYGAVAK